MIATAGGGEAKPVYSDPFSHPFYLYWSPDDDQIAFLTQERTELALRVASRSTGESSVLVRGNPLYFSWSPQGDRLAWHVGGPAILSPLANIGVGNVEDGRPVARPGFFRAPHWSPAAPERILVATNLRGSRDALAELDSQGNVAQSHLEYRGSIAFNWSPAGDRLAYLIENSSDPSLSGSLWSASLDGSERRRLSPRSVVAFFWAPDGERLAYLTLERAPGSGRPEAVFAAESQGGRAQPPSAQFPLTQLSPAQLPSIHLAWHVVGADGSGGRRLVTFCPGLSFLSLIPFFDQYGRSHRLWSPDSRFLTYTALDLRGVETVYALDTSEAEPVPIRIAPGSSPSWASK